MVGPRRSVARVVLGLASPDRDFGLPARQIEKLVAHDEFDPKARVSCVKGFEEGSS